MAHGSPYWPQGPRYLPSVPGYGHIRASDADRERAADVLKAGFAEGRLTEEEFAERQERALVARTYRDLAALTADLPVGPVGPFGGLAPQPVPPGGFPAARGINPLAVASLVSAFVPFFGSVAAIVLGHAALREIRETGERGTAVAAAGIALGYLVVVGFVLFGLAALLVGARSSGAYPAPPG